MGTYRLVGICWNDIGVSIISAGEDVDSHASTRSWRSMQRTRNVETLAKLKGERSEHVVCVGERDAIMS